MSSSILPRVNSLSVLSVVISRLVFRFCVYLVALIVSLLNSDVFRQIVLNSDHAKRVVRLP